MSRLLCTVASLLLLSSACVAVRTGANVKSASSGSAFIGRKISEVFGPTPYEDDVGKYALYPHAAGFYARVAGSWDQQFYFYLDDDGRISRVEDNLYGSMVRVTAPIVLSRFAAHPGVTELRSAFGISVPTADDLRVYEWTKHVDGVDLRTTAVRTVVADSDEALFVHQHEFAVIAGDQADPPPALKTHGMLPCLAVALYFSDGDHRVALLAHVDFGTDLRLAFEDFIAAFRAAGGTILMKGEKRPPGTPLLHAWIVGGDHSVDSRAQPLGVREELSNLQTASIDEDVGNTATSGQVMIRLRDGAVQNPEIDSNLASNKTSTLTATSAARMARRR